MNIKPLGNRVVVKLIKQKTTSNSGIILSSKEENEQSIGVIISIGDGYGDSENVNNLGLKINDKVMFAKYSGEEVKDQNDPDTIYKILEAKNIVAIIND